jgi:hypothetical protein
MGVHAAEILIRRLAKPAYSTKGKKEVKGELSNAECGFRIVE